IYHKKADESKKTDDEQVAEDQVDEQVHGDDEGGNEQARDAQANFHMPEAQPKKPKATLVSSTQTLSSTEFTNQFLNKTAEVTLTDVLKETVDLEIQSVTQEKPVEQRPPLVDTTRPETRVHTGELESRVTRLEKTVNAMSRFNLQEAIDKSVQDHLKKALPEDVPDFGKIKQKTTAKQSMLNHTRDIHKALYDALALSLSVDEDDMDRQLEEPHVQKKRRRDDHDQDPSADADKDSKKSKMKDSDAPSSKKTKDQPSSSKKGKSHSTSLKPKKFVNAEESVEFVVVDAEEMVKDGEVDDTGVDNDNDMAADDLPQDEAAPTQADPSAPKHDNSSWFKQFVVERPKTPDPEWSKEPNDLPNQSWFNDMVNAEKAPVTFEDVIVIEGQAPKLHQVEYNFKQCYLALTDQLDWVNPEGDRIPHDLSKLLPLQGAPGRLRILVDFFFNKDLEYLRTRNLEEKKYATSLTKPKAARYELGNIEEMILNMWRARQAVQSNHHVYSRMKVLSIVRITVDKQFGYGYLKKIVVRRADQKEYTFKEADFPRLRFSFSFEESFPGLDDKEPYTIFYEPRGVVYLYKDDKTYLMRKDKVHKFRDATIKKVCNKLDYMLHNFVLDYNESMPKRKWIEKDQQRTTSMLKALENTLLTRRIMRSLECFVGGRKIETDCLREQNDFVILGLLNSGHVSYFIL
ncbi:hypothetical protein Tco_1140064, partial [Tanacetum coccineum]